MSNNSTISARGYNGEFLDEVLNQYILGNGYRAYNPVLQRFTSPDSMSPFGAGGINPYIYCEGDPINRTDPTGHMDGRRLEEEHIHRERNRRKERRTERSRSGSQESAEAAGLGEGPSAAKRPRMDGGMDAPESAVVGNQPGPSSRTHGSGDVRDHQNWRLTIEPDARTAALESLACEIILTLRPTRVTYLLHSQKKRSSIQLIDDLFSDYSFNP